ncbi:MAG: ComF family protein [Clostridia bacterium]|nr:ComF family protein [Clostridia bacterium]
MSRLTEAIRRVFFPHHCYLCNEVLYPHQRVCVDCMHKAPYIYPPICQRCGRSKDDCYCGKRQRAFERCISPFYHQGVAQQGIYTLKSAGYRVTAEGFAAEMAEVVRREYGGIPFDFVTAVPLHKRERGERGFNQAEKLGQAMAKRLGLPYATVLTKITLTAPQKSLKAVERSGNLLGVFDVCGDVSGKTVLLVDDVITTGATLDECAKMLKIFGAEAVYGVTAAAAVLSNEEK